MFHGMFHGTVRGMFHGIFYGLLHGKFHRIFQAMLHGLIHAEYSMESYGMNPLYCNITAKTPKLREHQKNVGGFLNFRRQNDLLGSCTA